MRKTINIPIYHGELVIEQVENIRDIEKKYGFHNKVEFEAIVLRDHLENGYTRYVMVFKDHPEPQTIAHEALHTVSNIFEDRNMLMDTRDFYNEPQSYLIGWVVTQCYKYLKL